MSANTDSLPERNTFLCRRYLAVGLLFAVSLLLMFFAALQYYWPGQWWGDTRALAWKGETLTLMKGRGYGDGGKLRIDALAEDGVALATLTPPAFQAKHYPVVRWFLSGASPGTRIEFLWRTANNPERIFAREIEWTGGSTEPVNMAGDANWRGQVVEIMLMAHAPLNAPLFVDEVKFETPLGLAWREWFGAEQWLGTSVHFMGGNETRLWLGPLPFVAAVLGLALFGYAMLVLRKMPGHGAMAIWALVFMAWFMLDMRWQIDLWHKLGLTQQRYAGKSWEEKHLAADDGRLFGLMQQVRAKLPPDPARVFLFADAEYIRGRAAYHLYPFNVMHGRDLLQAAHFKSGDFIVILGKDEVEFDAAQRLLKWGGQRLHADLLLVAENNVLLKVR